jgi:hypothetical protein
VSIQSRWAELESPQKILFGLCGLSTVLLLASGDQHTRDYFTLMRFVVSCTGALAAWQFYRAGSVLLALAFGATALLFNPFAPVNLRRVTWQDIDWAAAALFAVGMVQIWRRR